MPAPPAVHTTVQAPAHSAAPEVAAPPVHATSVKWEASMVAPAAGPATHTVIVGGDAGLVYTPEHIQAEIGDLVHFVFHKQNHSVTQSTFDNPCVKKADSQFDSGLLPNPNNTVVPAPTWQYTVTAKEPTWWYCKQRTGSHCGKGMVFAINPTAEKTFNTFKEVAIKINGTNTATPAAPPAATAPSTTVTLDAGAGDKAPAPTSAPPATNIASPPAVATMPAIAPGWNAGAGGACNCACFCGTAAFPAAGQGVGAFGGLSGQLPSPWQPETKGGKARRAIAMKA
ncbi:hypothetical protein BJ508DRAFT_210729 [Ascobolus immersus RN42]|uniref:Cupredoxin n=1 Tax=Ascobolus immersus RN42 TaxID=1160509 RepID=A0A3N4IDW3_ASCIM|nr:hypothetical protein BJ508DRAFT_210729 [Ascobolus immersus RN42]